MRKLDAGDYPARIQERKRLLSAWRPPPEGRLREIKVTYCPSKVAVDKGKSMRCPYDFWRAFRRLAFEPVEVFRVAFLDCHMRLMAFEDIARGTVSGCLVHPREVFHSAVLLRASAVALLHNHPDGDLGASERDIHLTETLRKAGDVLGIHVLDHLIIGPSDCYSMRHNDWR